MFGKKASPNFHGETDVVPVPELPPITAQDLRTGIDPSRPKKSKLMIYIAIAVGFVVIMIGGVVLANYEGYLDISFLPSKKDKIVSEMMSAMQTIKKAKYTVSMSTKAEPWDGVHQPIEANINSEFPVDQSMVSGMFKDMQLELNVESYFDVDQAKTDLKNMNGYVKLSGVYGQGVNQMGINLEFRKIGEDIYGVLGDYPMLISTFVPQISELKGKWIKLSGDSEYGKYLDMVYQNQDLFSSSDATDSYNLAFKSGFIKLGKKLSSETLDGTETSHYQIEMDMDNFDDMYAQMIAQFAEMQNKTTDSNLQDIKISDLNPEELMTAETKKGLEQLLENMDIEIWFGDNDQIMRRMKASMFMVLPEAQRTDEVGQVRYDIVMNMSDINKSIEITAPESAMTITEVIDMFTPKDTDGDGLYDADEADYGTDINNPDTDGDSYLDGSEVENGYNPNGSGMLENQFGLNTDPMFGEDTSESCIANGGEWVIVDKVNANVCATITNWVDCEENAGCMWDSFSDSEIDCVPKADYCSCANGNEYFYGCD